MIGRDWTDQARSEAADNPEPQWRKGDVVLAADGITYFWHGYEDGKRDDDEPWAAATVGDRWWKRDSSVPRPLIHLVRDGKAVQ